MLLSASAKPPPSPIDSMVLIVGEAITVVLSTRNRYPSYPQQSCVSSLDSQVLMVANLPR